MDIKKFSNFSLKENKEQEEIENKEDNMSDVSEHSEDGIPSETDLDNIGEDEDEDEDEDQTSEVDNYSGDILPKNESMEATPTQFVIINGCEADSEIDKKTEEFKNKIGVDKCKEIFLYQLNIQTPKKQETKDGMMQVYSALENASAVIFACHVNKNKLSDSMENAIARIKNFYKKDELKNKVFGAIILGTSDEKIKNNLILSALNDFKMIVSGDCFFFANDKIKPNMAKLVDCIKTLSDATCIINSGCYDEDKEDDTISDIKPFGEYIDEEQLEEPTENSFEDEIENELEDELEDESENEMGDEDESENEDDSENIYTPFGDGSDVDIESEEDESEEEEEQIFDNEDGSITQIHKGKKVVESIKILNFEDYFKK
jgi:multimeric flavodoxin WrbA